MPFLSEFDLEITIGGRVLTESILGNSLQITHSEGESALCDIVLIPPAGSQDLDEWHGKAVQVNVVHSSGSYRIFTGRVDYPEFDLIGKTTTLRCTDSRIDRLESLTEAQVRMIGYYSAAVFGEPSNRMAELEARLSTIPYALDYDTLGNRRLTAWEPKATADHTLADSSIYRRTPTVTVLPSNRVVNNITINLEYQYQRLRQRHRSYTFDSELGACTYGVYGLPPTATELQETINAAGWQYTNFSYSPLDAAGIYSCQAGGLYTATTTRLYWSTTNIDAVKQPKLDSSGNTITDTQGSTVYESVPVKITDTRYVYANDATWTASKRFAQNISEQITLTVTAPQSITQYGQVDREYSFGYADEFPTDAWEDYTAHAAPPAISTVSANGDYTIDKTDNLGEYNAAMQCALAKARTEIIAAHRDNRVLIQTPVWPQVQLHHTIETTGGVVRCKGKASKIKHYFNLSDRDAFTEVEISLSRAPGTATDSGLTLPTRPSVTDEAFTPSQIVLKTHTIPIGGKIDDAWTGYIFQETARPSASLPYGLKVPVAMIIDTQGVDAASRDTKTATGTATNTVLIRNDLLEIDY